jgi:hypothetical protein
LNEWGRPLLGTRDLICPASRFLVNNQLSSAPQLSEEGKFAPPSKPSRLGQSQHFGDHARQDRGILAGLKRPGIKALVSSSDKMIPFQK